MIAPPRSSGALNGIVGEMQDLRYGFSVSRLDPISEGNPENGIRGFCCQSPRDVRFGSKADIRAAKSHVRFIPESRHVQCTSACPLWAKSGHLPKCAASTQMCPSAIADFFLCPLRRQGTP